MSIQFRYHQLVLLATILIAGALFPVSLSGQEYSPLLSRQEFLPPHEWFAAYRIKEIRIYSEKGDTSKWRQMNPDTARWSRKLKYDLRRNTITEYKRSDKDLEVNVHFSNEQTATVYDSLSQGDGIWKVNRLSSSAGGYPRETLTYKDGTPVQKQVSTPDSIFNYAWSGTGWRLETRTRLQEKVIYDESLQPKQRWLYYEGSFLVKEKTTYSRHRNQEHSRIRHYDDRGRYLGTTTVLTDNSDGTYFFLKETSFNRRGQAAGYPRKTRMTAETSSRGGHGRAWVNGKLQNEYDLREDSAKPWARTEYSRDLRLHEESYVRLEPSEGGYTRMEKKVDEKVPRETAYFRLNAKGQLEYSNEFGTPGASARISRYSYDKQGRVISKLTAMDTTPWQEEYIKYVKDGAASIVIQTSRHRKMSSGPAHNWPWVESTKMTVYNAVNPYKYDSLLAPIETGTL